MDSIDLQQKLREKVFGMLFSSCVPHQKRSVGPLILFLCCTGASITILSRTRSKIGGECICSASRQRRAVAPPQFHSASHAHTCTVHTANARAFLQGSLHCFVIVSRPRCSFLLPLRSHLSVRICCRNTCECNGVSASRTGNNGGEVANRKCAVGSNHRRTTAGAQRTCLFASLLALYQNVLLVQSLSRHTCASIVDV